MKRKRLFLHLLLLVIYAFSPAILHSQSINIISPNGGENWPAMTTHTVTWTSSGTSGYVKIEYSHDNGNYWTVITNSTTDNGSYSWHVPDIQSQECLLRIMDVDGDPSGISDDLFTISNSPGFIGDSLALVALYNSTNGPGWINNTNWLSQPVSDWYGINMFRGRVSGIFLNDNQLTGSLPSEIGNLSYLERLTLYNNHLTGNIPSEIGQLTFLSVLSLYSNQLTGNIPPEIGNLSNLNRIQLSGNQLTGNIPDEIGNLTRLTSMSLYSNQLTGNIPSEIGQLTNLEYLSLYSNQLTGNIPPEIGYLSNLRIVYLNRNQLTGNIPSEIGCLTDHLINLSLYSNQLTGSIPPEIGNLLELQELNLNNNKLSGIIPAEIGNLSDLRILNLGGNQFTGDIPEEIRNLTYLKNLYITNCRFENLPQLNNLTDLDYLNIESNRFTFEDIEPNVGIAGIIFTYSPQDMVGEAQNITINAGDNYTLSVSVGGDHNMYQWYKNGLLLAGETNNTVEIVNAVATDAGIYECQINNAIATQLTLYSRPVTLSILGDGLFADSLALVALYNSTNGQGWNNRTNWLTGPVNTWYGITVDGGRVTGINLSNNKLTGLIPSEIESLTNLRMIYMSDNQLNGSIPFEIGNLSNLQKLSLGRNQLTGNIPTELSSLTNLQELYLFDNQLTGNIPPEIGNLINLQKLFLCNNQLTGSIPPQIGNLLNLQDIELYTNQLTGNLPPEISNLNNLKYFNASGNFLTGNVPAEFGYMNMLQVLSLGRNLLDGSIPAELGGLSNLEVIHLDNNRLSGTIPTEICNLNNLRTIHLAFNQITGEIPPEIGDLDNMEFLYLNNNQLTGNIPSEIGNLQNLKGLFLGNNKIYGSVPYEINNLVLLLYLSIPDNNIDDLPDIGSLISLTNLNIEDNRLTFEDIEPNMSVASSIFTCAPQDLVGESQNIILDQGDNCIISVSVGGENNLYQWYKDKLLLSGEQNDTLKIINFSKGDEGVYECHITNSVVTQLTLYSRPITLKVELPFKVISPNGGESWPAMTTQNITWTSSGTSGDVYIEYSTDNGMSWYDITASTPDDGLYLWQVPVELSTQCLVRLSDKDGEPSDISDAVFTISEPPEIVRDSLALVALYNSTNGPEWINNTNWLTGSVSSWFGVTVNDGRVTNLWLNSNGLAGEIPAEIGNISKLESIHLNNNQLTGNIPHEIGNLSQLYGLYLYENQLSGIIPPEIFHLTNLLGLDLCYNNFSGTIPAEIGNLRNLKYLHLQDNELTGSIPAEIGNLKDLLELRLYDNQLTGNIPAEIGNLTKLMDLLLSGNHLSGTIPAELGNLSDLIYLKLYDNDLTGEIPAEIGNLTGLLLLDLSSNNLIGSIPSEIGNLNIVSTIRLSENQLNGSVPEEINRLVCLEYFYLKDNLIEDLPALNGLTRLKWLYIENNKLTFEDIEPNHSVVQSYFLYSPQDSVGDRKYIPINEGFGHLLSITVGGEHNVYQWFKDGEIISGANAADYEITNAETGDAGIYECHITNTVATELTLYSRPITVTVIPNTPPVVTDIPDQIIDEGGLFSSIDLDQYISDIETADADITWTYSGNSELIVTIANRTATIMTPDVSWNGKETIIFTATDDDPVNPLSDSDTVIFIVAGVNSAPVVSSIPDQTIPEGFAFETINLDDYVTDVETPDDRITWTYSGNSELTVTITNRLATITVPAADWYGSETIIFTATDDAEVPLSGSDLCVLTVTAVNDPPVVNDIPDQMISDDTTFVAINLNDYVEDIETADENLNWICSGNSELNVTIADGIAQISRPDMNWTGSETLIFTATDNDPLNPLSDRDTAMFTVVHKNEAPVLGQIPDQTIQEGGSFEAINLDDFVEDDETSDENITWSFSGNVDLQVTITDRVADITIPDENWNGSEAITFSALDDNSLNPLSADTGAIFTVTGINDAPVISDIPDQTINNGEVFIQIDLNDYMDDIETEDEKIEWSCIGNTHIQVEIIDGIATFVLPDPKWSGTDTVTFTAVDDDLLNPLSASKTIIFTVKSISGSKAIPIIESILPYPNPVDRYVILPVSNLNAGEINIEISGINGAVLSVRNYPAADDQVEIDMDGYYPGIYLIRVISSDNTGIFKIIKQ